MASIQKPPYVVRTSKPTIEGLKNVEHGKIVFDNGEYPSTSSVTAIRGQNGSGKTAVIDTREILRDALCGFPPRDVVACHVNTGADKTRLTWTFALQDTSTGGTQKVDYGFDVRVADGKGRPAPSMPQIAGEKLRTWERKPQSRTMPRIRIDTSDGEPFPPDSQVRFLTGVA